MNRISITPLYLDSRMILTIRSELKHVRLTSDLGMISKTEQGIPTFLDSKMVQRLDLSSFNIKVRTILIQQLDVKV
jgi:hypothetical protein